MSKQSQHPYYGDNSAMPTPMPMPVPVPASHGPENNLPSYEDRPTKHQSPPAYEPPKPPMPDQQHGAPGAQPGNVTYTQTTSCPLKLHCPICKRDVPVYVEKNMGNPAIAMTVVLCCLAWPLALIPLLSDSFKDDMYHCSVCQSRIGKVHDIGPAPSN
ncbi:hypothetical protein GGI25_001118 [Coemansia spiralis]|uniref:LITAF domain-containing protein n=2 Tax=Coemansia TaxID=4863 RepID=A0A9W8G687_9FUNG|nr:hypothetical protein BX070DRAFT_255337 [Coemansia spiralis]KAJ1995550.1 hypothetical protein EDC05_000788 [Coemansia umbellata]KAJ2625118.1 hypothetical protein GGI26_000921 [Coemansia sp. RSA 1358]KAJ2679929.1 hypothetical protein GGI25_001118 [Coemansia spiralis]